MPERLLREREFKDAVVCTCFDQKDLRLYQARTSRNLGRSENKVDHLIKMTEGEVRRGLREHKNLNMSVSNRARKSQSRSRGQGTGRVNTNQSPESSMSLTTNHVDKETCIHVRRLPANL